jgi:ribonuclease VapC
MILDSSAMVAIALDEPEAAEFRSRIEAADSVAVPAPMLIETGIVLSSRSGEDATQLLADLLGALNATVIDFGANHWREALSAWWRFGKGRHPASLNFGDCMAYSAARLAHQPLLAKGGDFRQTDIELA